MSQVYSTEPQTTGRIILNTTSGPIDINLWCKECPTVTRTFLQLCLDGYYDGMIFHRIINNFLIQTGEVKKDNKNNVIAMKEEGEGSNGQYMSKYGFAGGGGGGGGGSEETIPGSEEFMTRKRLEFSPRIRFNHRGQVAMALPLDDDNVTTDNTSSSLARQFFITMDEAPFLQSKYVIFGTVSGDTIFNAMRIGRTETIDEESGQLADVDNAPMIKDVRIESHLFDDLVMTKESSVPWKVIVKNDSGDAGMSELKKRRKKRKGKKDLNVLSFGAEMEDGDDDINGGAETRGMLSSYDVLKSSSVSAKSATVEAREEKSESKKRRKDNSNKEKESDTNFHLEKDINISNNEDKIIEAKSTKNSPKYEQHKRITKNTKQEDNSRRQNDKSSNKRKDDSTTNDDHSSKKPKISAVEARRLKYLKMKTGDSSTTNRKGSKQRDDNTMSKLSAFKSKMFEVKGTKKGKGSKSDQKKRRKEEDDSLAAKMIRSEEVQLEASSQSDKKKFASAPVYSGQVLDDDNATENDPSWLKSRFKCKRHIDHDSKDSIIGGDGRNMDDYEVIDDKRDGNRDRSRNRDRDRNRDRMRGRDRDRDRDRDSDSQRNERDRGRKSYRNYYSNGK